MALVGEKNEQIQLHVLTICGNLLLSGDWMKQHKNLKTMIIIRIFRLLEVWMTEKWGSIPTERKARQISLCNPTISHNIIYQGSFKFNTMIIRTKLHRSRDLSTVDWISEMTGSLHTCVFTWAPVGYCESCANTGSAHLFHFKAIQKEDVWTDGWEMRKTEAPERSHPKQGA